MAVPSVSISLATVVIAGIMSLVKCSNCHASDAFALALASATLESYLGRLWPLLHRDAILTATLLSYATSNNYVDWNSGLRL